MIETNYKNQSEIAEWELAIQNGDLEEYIDNHLYDLHKRVWNSSKIIPERLERYENAVESYRSLGFDIGEHGYYVLLYKYMLRRQR